MRVQKMVVIISLVALAGCSSSLKQSGGYITQPEVCVDRWYGYHLGTGCPSTAKAVVPDPAQEMAARLAALETQRSGLANELEAARKKNGALSSRVNDLERQLANAKTDRDQTASKLAAMQGSAGEADKLSSELTDAKQRIADLESQLADRDKELAGLRGDLSAEMAKLKEAERGLIRSLGPQIKKGDITVHLNDERLLINLASGYLFASGEDELKPAGADALKQVGGILKDYPEYNVAVDGHTDNQPIRGALKNKFPTNMELSEARAANAARALDQGGLSTATTHGYADTKPKAPNTTEAGRAKNRRVEVRVTK
ncbi:MAG: OmpA family protein [Nitrospira sp.]|nr:OmpA family protein [Nitrospira sp.]